MKLTESKIFRKAKSAYEFAMIVALVFWLPIMVILFGALFQWK